MAAELLEEDRFYLDEESFADVKIWKVPQPVRGSPHFYKYRLAFIVKEQCVLRYDNEAGKGDHKHIGNDEIPIHFKDLETLRNDFLTDVREWRLKR